MTITIKTESGDSAIAHIENHDGRYKGTLYPVTECHYIYSDEIGLEYESSADSSVYFKEPNEECKIYFRFEFCWRGVWEGRIYFPNDEEFWDRELKVMSDLWDLLEKELQSKIIEANPEYFK